MYYASADEMAKLDELAVASGLEIRQMMELAGWHMLRLFQLAEVEAGSSVAIVVGKGNKGGDGLSAARHLVNHGYEVTIFLLETDISPDAQHHLDLLKKMNASIEVYASQDFNNYDVIIDSLIGYRLQGAPRGKYAQAIQAINDSPAKVIAYDLPTGINATTGKTEGEFVRANYTLMLALPKKALNNPSNRDMFGKVVISDIGIPLLLYNRIKPNSRPNFDNTGILEV